MKPFALGAIAILLTACSSQPSEVAEANTAVKKIEAPPEPKVVTSVIPSGTRIRVRTTSTISTKTATSGEAFSGNLSEPILIDGKTVLPRGASVSGVVADSDEGGRVKGVASLSLRLTHINAGGKTLPVQSSLFTKAAPTSKKNDAVKVGVGAGIGAAIGAIAGGGKGAGIGAASGAGAGTAVVLATRGKPAVVSAESIVSFRLTSPLTVTVTEPRP